MPERLFVIAEQSRSGISPVTFELLACAEQIRRIRPASVELVVPGADVRSFSSHLSQVCGLNVIGIEHPALSVYNGEVYKAAFADLFKARPALGMLAAHSSAAWEFVPGLACRLRGACVTGVNAVARVGDDVVFQRLVQAGRFTESVSPAISPFLITVEPGAFPTLTCDDTSPGSVEIRRVSIPERSSRTLAVLPAGERNLSLTEGEVVVAAGKGIKKKENLDMIRQLASVFPKSAVAGSRPLIDSGWLEYKRQVGLTGAKVTPRLYFACGISGAPQHIAGMRGADTVVALNTDCVAAMFNHADVCIVDDLLQFIPAFIRLAKRS